MTTPDSLAAPAPRPLRFLACGSVDDGKSTLIGRLLHDCGNIPDDQLQALRQADGQIDYAHLVDGLEAEREQGITIEVCYRYFRTRHRAFVVADCPGHEAFTGSMASGASCSEAAIILIDATRGVLEQTRRHAAICSLMGIGPVLAVVNKMDLAGFDQGRFDQVREAFTQFAGQLGLTDVTVIPAVARTGAQVVQRDARLDWFGGPTVLEWLHAVQPRDPGGATASGGGGRLPVQWIVRDGQAFRGQAGTVSRGRLSVGDGVVSALHGHAARISRIIAPGADRQWVDAGEAAVIVLDRPVDVGRGDVLCRQGDVPPVGTAFTVRLIWMAAQEGLPGRSYWLRCGTAWRRVTLTRILHGVDPVSLAPTPRRALACNEIAVCNLSTSEPLACDDPRTDPALGTFVLVDRASARTMAAGLIVEPLAEGQTVSAEATLVDGTVRARLLGHRSLVIWLTGLSGSGKSTIAREAERRLVAMGRLARVLDGDNLRQGLNRDLGFSPQDRAENIRRAGEVAMLLADAGLIVLCAFISPYEADRDAVRERFATGRFLEVHVSAPLEVCRARDPKALYRKAEDGALTGLTGLASPYETPAAPDLILHTGTESVEESVSRLMAAIEHHLALPGPA